MTTVTVSQLNELMAQRAALDAEIQRVVRETRENALNNIRSIMAENGLNLTDLQNHLRSHHRTPNPTKGQKVPVKYRDPVTGNTWAGKGVRPRWLTAALASGRSISEFYVGAGAPAAQTTLDMGTQANEDRAETADPTNPPLAAAEGGDSSTDLGAVVEEITAAARAGKPRPGKRA